MSKYIQFEVFQNCLKWVVYINTLFSPCIAWIGMESCLKFCILITAVYFKDRNQISKTVYCISCLVVCKIVFCSKFPNFPDKSREREEEHRQLQSVMRFTQTQEDWYFANIWHKDDILPLKQFILKEFTPPQRLDRTDGAWLRPNASR